MGRCQSTPGLVETKGRTPIEEMWLCQPTHTALTYYNPQSLFRYTSFPLTLSPTPDSLRSHVFTMTITQPFPNCRNPPIQFPQPPQSICNSNTHSDLSSPKHSIRPSTHLLSFVDSRAPSPRQGVASGREDLIGCNERKKSVTMTETPCSLSPSSDERPRSRTASHLSRPQSQHSRAGKDRILMFCV